MKSFPYLFDVAGVNYGVELLVDDSARLTEGVIEVPANSKYGFNVIVPTDRIEFVLLLGGRLVTLTTRGIQVSDDTNGVATMRGIPVTPAIEDDDNVIDGFILLDEGPEVIEIALYVEEPLEFVETATRGTDASQARAHSVVSGSRFRRGDQIAHFFITLNPV